MQRHRSHFTALLLSTAALYGAACAPTPPTFHAQQIPKTLSEWGQLRLDGGMLVPAEGVEPYDLNLALFSDYAHKLRTVWIDGDEPARYDDVETFDFPVGTVITKTFYYPTAAGGGVLRTIAGSNTEVALDGHRLMETRVLVRREQGWIALPYVWNEEQTDATLEVIGASFDLHMVGDDGESTDFEYIVPDANQCAGCHVTNQTTKELRPIGPRARHLNRELTYADGSENQLRRWARRGLLTGLPESAPQTARWDGALDSLPATGTAELEATARGYLDINCAHCHNRVGPADTSALFLEPETPSDSFGLGRCKPPVAAGRGTGDRLYAIHPGRAGESILTYRMRETDPSIAMPELGRSTTHDEGVELMARWIDSLAGEC